jgi:hypothetical protein
MKFFLVVFCAMLSLNLIAEEPPPPPQLPEYLSLLETIIRNSNVDYSELVVAILKDTTILDTLNFSILAEQVRTEKVFFDHIDTVKEENKIYYYRTSIFGKRRIAKAEKYDSRNLLIESSYFGDTRVSEKFFINNKKIQKCFL